MFCGACPSLATARGSSSQERLIRHLAYATVIAIAAFVLASSASGDPSSAPALAKQTPKQIPRHACPYTHWRISTAQARTWKAQLALDLPLTRAGDRPAGCAYARWVADRWRARWKSLEGELARQRAVVARLDRYLARSPMRGTGRILERVGRREGVSPFFIAGVAAKESSLGAAACGSNRYNVWGLGACGRAWSPPYFDSWEAAIDYFARFVKGRTPAYRGWPSARTPWDYHGYCQGCESSWASGVVRHMAAMGAGTSVRYP